MSWVGPPACQDGIVTLVSAEYDIATLEDGGGVTEDEVDAAVDVAFSVELAEGEGVECVLVANDATLVENGVIRRDVQS